MPEVLEQEKLELTPAQIHSEEAHLIGENPFRLVEHGFLSIKTKNSGIVKLYPNSAQKIILKKIKERFFSVSPVRILLLKARQMGMTTLIEAIMYAFTSRMKGINACVIADDLDGSNYIFEMQKMFQEYLEIHLKPKPKHSNEKKLAFQGLNSQIIIDTAENPKVGRKYTFQFVHLSEVAFFQHSLKNIMLGLNQSVPQGAGTMIFLETTANGVGNEFYDLWTDATRGLNDWLPLFIGWNEMPEYKRPLEGDKLYPIDGIKFASSEERKRFNEEEVDLIKRYKLSGEQINWRRWTIVNACNGSVLSFRQEYPISAEEAFIATGDVYFDRNGLLSQVEKKPLAIGNFVSLDKKMVFREDSEGLWKIYEYPDPHSQYCIGGDPCEGLPHGDFATGVILNKRTNNTAATYRHKSAPDQFAIDLVDAAKFYNMCMIACENKGYGSSANKDMYKVYGNIFRMIKSHDGSDKPSQDLGWNTNVTSRRMMLAQLAEEIRENATGLFDGDLIRECWTFIKNKDRGGNPEADKGKTDDMIFARAIAGMVRSYYPYVTRMSRDSYNLNRNPQPNQGIGFKTE
jgi:hypothetical protein